MGSGPLAAIHLRYPQRLRRRRFLPPSSSSSPLLEEAVHAPTKSGASTATPSPSEQRPKNCARLMRSWCPPSRSPKFLDQESNSAPFLSLAIRGHCSFTRKPELQRTPTRLHARGDARDPCPACRWPRGGSRRILDHYGTTHPAPFVLLRSSDGARAWDSTGAPRSNVSRPQKACPSPGPAGLGD